MFVYSVVGVEKFSGTSKSTGEAFSMTKLFLTYSDPGNKNLVGSNIMELVPFDSVFRNSGYEPTVGDRITLDYGPNYKGDMVLRSICRVK